jgi:16S rRNA (guanine527-N7)-methyltransferase
MLLRSETEAREFVAKRCNAQSLALLERFADRLRKETSAQNLIAASTLDSLWLRHIADSAQLLDHVSRGTSSWIDLGAGAGFPGVVIAAMVPDREVILIESRALRIQWLEQVIAALDLQNCRVIGQDVRKVSRLEGGVISARAFAPLPRLIEVSARFSTNATEWVLPKGRSAAQDIAKLPLRLQARFHVKQSVTDADAGIVLARGQFDSVLA